MEWVGGKGVVSGNGASGRECLYSENYILCVNRKTRLRLTGALFESFIYFCRCGKFVVKYFPHHSLISRVHVNLLAVAYLKIIFIFLHIIITMVSLAVGARTY